MVNGLRMQSEDDKAKASGIALATVGLVVSKFSLLFAVLAGGAAVYAGKFETAANSRCLEHTNKSVITLQSESHFQGYSGGLWSECNDCGILLWTDTDFIDPAKLPKEGDEGLSDTAKQVSLLVGTYSLKLADFVKEKDAEAGYSQKLLSSVKEGTSMIDRYILNLPYSDSCDSFALQPSSQQSPRSSRPNFLPDQDYQAYWGPDKPWAIALKEPTLACLEDPCVGDREILRHLYQIKVSSVGRFWHATAYGRS
jgi:hypothetical protein